MNLRIALVPTWRHAWRWFSVWAAGAVVVISTARETAQQLVDTDPNWQWLAHARWYPTTMLVLGAMAALLRLVHQPVVTDTDSAPPPAADAVPLPKEDEMNAVWQEVIDILPGFMHAAEAALPFKGAGAQKATAVINAVTTAVPQVAPIIQQSSDGAAKVQNYIAGFAVLLNALSPLFKQSAATPPPNAG